MRLPPLGLLAGTVAAAALSAALAGPAAGATSPAEQLVQNAITASEHASSFKVVGTVYDNGKKHTIDVSASSTVGEGTIGVGNGTALIRLVGGTVYLKGTSTYWNEAGGKSAAELFVGKWVSTSAGSSTGKALVPLLTTTGLIEEFFSGGLADSTFHKSGTARVDGEKATVISGADTTDKNAGRIYIAASGRPYLLEVTATGSSQGTILFSHYNQRVDAVAPANAIDLDTLGNNQSTSTPTSGASTATSTSTSSTTSTTSHPSTSTTG